MDHPSEDRLMLHVGGELPDDERRRIEEHAAHCHACRATLEHLAEMDAVLRSLPPAAVPASFAARVRARVLTSGAGRGWWRQAAAAVVLLAAGIAGGWALGRTDAPQPAAIVRQGEGPKFAMIFAEDPATTEGASAAERARRYREFMQWMSGLGDQTVRLGGSQLDDTRGRIVSASGRSSDSGLVLSGFLIVRAATYDEVVAHARRCPIVARGGQVIVRQLMGP